MLNLTSFEAPYNVTWCIAPSIASPLEVGQIKGRKFPVLPDISGDPSMNCPLVRPTPQGDKSLYSPTLVDLHGTHQGTNRMQAQVREAVHWSGIDADIANYVCQCTICTRHKASLPAQPMLPRDIPDGPWQEITAKYLAHKG